MLQSIGQANTVIDAQNVRDCHTIASEIKILTKQGQSMALYFIIEIGKRLKEAKEMMDHGQWGNWLENEVSYSQSTAENFMRIASEYGNDQVSLFETSNSQALENLGYTKLVALLAVPGAERAEFAKEVNADKISTRELQNKIKELQLSKEKAEEDKRNLKNQIEEQKRYSKTVLDSLERQRETAQAEAQKAAQQADKLRKELEQLKELKQDIPEDTLHKIRIEAENKIKEELSKKLSSASEKQKQAEEKAKEAEKKIRSEKERLQKEYQEKIADLQKDREETQKRFQKTLDQVSELEKRLKVSGDMGLAKFNFLFQRIQQDFEELSASLAQISDTGLKEKCRKAILSVLENMKTQAKEGAD